MIIKIITLALCAIIICCILKNYRPEFGMVIAIGTSLVILYYIVNLLSVVKEQCGQITWVIAENENYLIMLFKMMGITYLCEFCSGICKDAGYQAIGNQVEIWGKLFVAISGFPILLTLLDTIRSFSF